MERHESEDSRREEAQRNKGRIEEGAGSKGTPKQMSQMVSVRLDGSLVSELKVLADNRKKTLSDLLREAVEDLVKRTRSQNEVHARSWVNVATYEHSTVGKVRLSGPNDGERMTATV